MTTIKHPVRTSLLAAILGLIVIIVSSRAHAADVPAAAKASSCDICSDISVSHGDSTVINSV